jgi:hypothetical protein
MGLVVAVEPEADDEVDDVNAYSMEDVSAAFKRQASKTMRRLLLDEGLRSDGRAPGDIRPIWSAAGLLPKVCVCVCVCVCMLDCTCFASQGGVESSAASLAW